MESIRFVVLWVVALPIFWVSGFVPVQTAWTQQSVGQGSDASNFDIAGKWSGTIKLKGVGNVYDEEGMLTFELTELEDGTLKGHAHFRRTANRPKPFGRCTHTRKYSADEFDLPIAGMREGDDLVLDITTRAAMGTITFGGCPSGGGRAVPAGLLAPFGAGLNHPSVRANEGATKTFHHETPGGAGALVSDATLELHGFKILPRANY